MDESQLNLKEFISNTKFELNRSREQIIHLELKLEAQKEDVKTYIVLIFSAIIFLMQCGFAFLEAGSVRSKNTTNILLKNLLDTCLSAISYYIVGWALSFGQPCNALFSYGQFFSIGTEPAKFAFWFLHFLFAANASTIVSGALAERCQIFAYMIHSVVVTAFIYPIIAHWVWDETGWLNNGPFGLRYLDFAGSGAVHLVGGICGLTGTMIVGPRIGRFDKHAARQPIKGHSVPFAMLGAFLLMFGFFAFNGASAVDQGGTVVALCMINTMLCASGGTLTALFVARFLMGNTWKLTTAVDCTLAAMVASCAACDQIEPWAAIIIGMGAALTSIGATHLLTKHKVDDPLNAVSVHGGGGLIGLITGPLFSTKSGIFYNVTDGLAFLGLLWNIIGALAIIFWSATISAAVFLLLKHYKWLRVSKEVEINGLDIHVHGEPAYPLVAYGHGWAGEIFSQEDTELYENAYEQMADKQLGLGHLANLSLLRSARHIQKPPSLYLNRLNSSSGAENGHSEADVATPSSRVAKFNFESIADTEQIDNMENEEIDEFDGDSFDIRDRRYRHLLPAFTDDRRPSVEIPRQIKFQQNNESLDSWLRANHTPNKDFNRSRRSTAQSEDTL